jgi:citrate lyase subunit beta/citryl-CoA lyase
MLFMPGNNPGMLQSADIFDADSVIFDLEDSVSIEEKDSALILVTELMKSIQLNANIVIRINPYDTAFYQTDLDLIKQLNINTILLPKASLQSMKDLDSQLEKTNINIFALIETAQGIEDVYEILKSTSRCVGLILGGEDLSVDLNCERTKEGTELFYARTRVVNAAKALKKIVVDTPFTDTIDEMGLKNDCLTARKLGFDGKASINPRQIDIINTVFSPSEKEIKFALRVIDAKNLALENGLGVFSLDGKMVDLPVIKRAEFIVHTAVKIGLIKGENDEN